MMHLRFEKLFDYLVYPEIYILLLSSFLQISNTNDKLVNYRLHILIQQRSKQQLIQAIYLSCNFITHH